MKPFYVFLISSNPNYKKYMLKQVESENVMGAINTAFPEDVLEQAKKIICAPIDFDFQKFREQLLSDVDGAEE